MRNRTPLTLLGPALCASLALAAPLAQAAGDPSSWKNPLPEQPQHLLLRNATLWTSAEGGVLEGGDMLIRQGKIVAVDEELAAPAGAVVMDLTGKHVTPGLIDAHSHAAVLGGVNESTRAVTAEVRIADVINSDSIQIYRQLAGGVTALNLLHGSANPIGGQNAVIKLRWGALPEDLLFGAPQGIKFALGENPKRARSRYPNTRQGVEQVIRERFAAAQDYQRKWKEHEATGGKSSSAIAPRRDLQLEAIAEILEGKRWVHSHSYRADEILMLLRLAEDFDFRIASLQHVLEGYKVADEIAAHGAGASTFSDWWAYKYEVIDAIPYNGAIMWDRGVTVSFNSDNAELARRLNLEAAKAVRYGGVPEADALRFVTLNPAIQLRVSDRIGSLETGKDADFVIWSGHPLSTYTLCEQTWIDGRRYFDRAQDLETRGAIAAERQALIEKVKAKDTKEEGPPSEVVDPPEETPGPVAAWLGQAAGSPDRKDRQ